MTHSYFFDMFRFFFMFTTTIDDQRSTNDDSLGAEFSFHNKGGRFTTEGYRLRTLGLRKSRSNLLLSDTLSEP